MSVTRKKQVCDVAAATLAAVTDAVPTDPRLPWVQPGWLAEATAWIERASPSATSS